MTDERAVRMAQENAALAAAIRRHIEIEEHAPDCVCGLCVALAVHDRRQPSPNPEGPHLMPTRTQHSRTTHRNGGA